MKRSIALLAVAGTLAACGLGQPPIVPVAPEVPQAPVVERPQADPESRDALVAYGARHPDVFGGLYMDPPGGDTVVMLFTDDLETHAEAVNAIRLGTRVRRVEYTKAQLDALFASLDLQSMMTDQVQPLSAGVNEERNRVFLELKTDDLTLELSLELAHGGMLEVTVHPLPGPWANIESGDGWRLVATGEASAMEGYVVRAATDADAWEEMWGSIGLGGAAPAIDIADEVVVSFGHGIGSGCTEVRLDGVTIQDGVVFSETSDPLSPRACTADLAGAAMFLVAIERASLPADGFTLRLRPDDIGEEIEVPLP